MGDGAISGSGGNKSSIQFEETDKEVDSKEEFSIQKDDRNAKIEGREIVELEKIENEPDKEDKDKDWKKTAAKIAKIALFVGIGVAVVGLTTMAVTATVLTGGAALPIVIGVGYGLYVAGSLAVVGGMVAEKVLGPDQIKKNEAAENFNTRFTETGLNTYHKILNPGESSYGGIKGQKPTTLEEVLKETENKKPCKELVKVDELYQKRNKSDLSQDQKNYLNNHLPKSWDIDKIKKETDYKKRVEMINELKINESDEISYEAKKIPKNYREDHVEECRNLLVVQAKALQLPGTPSGVLENKPPPTA